MNGAVILAAGLSSRMGDFKPLLPIGGSTFIDLIIDRMRKAGVERFSVVTGWRADELEAHLAQAAGVRCVRNEAFAQTHMFESVQIGLAGLPDGLERVLVTPADIPLVDAMTIKRLLTCRAACACPEDTATRRSGHPLMISGATARALVSLDAGLTLKTALAELGIRPVKVLVDDSGVCLDADTQEDYGELLARWADAQGEAVSLRPRSSLSVFAGPCELTEETMRLLELVGTSCGSLQQACRAMRISYTTAWRRIGRAEEALGFSLVERVSGGARGGTSRLTERGKDLLDRYRACRSDVEDALAESFARRFGDFADSMGA